VARRLAANLMLGPSLDAHYKEVKPVSWDLPKRAKA
jgi:hypothetical protein